MNIEEMTEELVKLRTVEGNLGEIEKGLQLVEKELPEDFDIQRFEEEGEKSLLATRGEPQILLHGHIDVVDAKDSLFRPERRNGRIYGRGTADMKSGIACIIEAAQKVEAENLGILITSDEERGGFNGTGHVTEETGIEPELVISAEPDDSGHFPSIVTEQKGVLQLELKASGENAHASKPDRGENAAEKLLKKYMEFRSGFNHEAEFGTTINLGNISAEGPVNQIPDKASLQVDIRYSNQYPKEEVLRDLEEMGGLEYEVLAEAPMLETSEENSGAQALKTSAEEVSGETVDFRRENFASDMRFFTEKGVPAVCFGPEGYNLHAEDEYVEVESLEAYCEILKSFLRSELN
ncbi:M20/M25/M40 family metallo-hydrolase [Candidatus Nanohaloarchaea archaeon]|nr:M20/M25/M40 family metallo-hydrolase [Candidatus Nanohaloarchaea archaeon]